MNTSEAMLHLMTGSKIKAIGENFTVVYGTTTVLTGIQSSDGESYQEPVILTGVLKLDNGKYSEMSINSIKLFDDWEIVYETE